MSHELRRLGALIYRPLTQIYLTSFQIDYIYTLSILMKVLEVLKQTLDSSKMSNN